MLGIGDYDALTAFAEKEIEGVTRDGDKEKDTWSECG